MNPTLTLLDELSRAARADKELASRLLATKNAPEPMDAFCEAAADAGYPLTPGGLLAAGEEYVSNLIKSVNGGATYPIDGWDDPYEQFFASLAFRAGK